MTNDDRVDAFSSIAILFLLGFVAVAFGFLALFIFTVVKIIRHFAPVTAAMATTVVPGAPGWYPDPSRLARERWWTGRNWATNTR